MAKPGIMLYFDILEPIRALPDREKGRLLTAMLEYGQKGTLPRFEGRLALAWGFIQPRLDKDSEEYDRTVLKRQYASFCRDRKKKGEPEISFQEWKSMEDQKEQVVSHDITWSPATTTETATETETATATETETTTETATETAAAATTTTTDSTAAAAQQTVKAFGGRLGKNVVFLSEAQIEDLLERMDLASFDYYVDKLAEFIIRNEARVKNHYETILRWYAEDGRTQ